MLSIVLNGEPRVLSTAATTVADLVRELSLEGRRIAIEMNGEIVPKSAFDTTAIASGAKIEIVVAVGGG